MGFNFRVGIDVRTPIDGKLQTRDRVLIRDRIEFYLDVIALLLVGSDQHDSKRLLDEATQVLFVALDVSYDCAKTLVAVADALKEAAKGVTDRKLLPARPDQGGSELALSHGLYGHDDVGDDELKAIRRKAAGLPH